MADLIHFDCYSGAAGNMLLGALLDAGVPRRVVRESIASLGIDGIRLRVSSVTRSGLAARYVRIAGPKRDARQRRWCIAARCSA